MAEKAAVFGRMGLRQGRFLSRSMAALTEFFRLLFFHGHETLMITIVGQRRRGFRGRIEKKGEDAPADREKKAVREQYFVFGCHSALCRRGAVNIRMIMLYSAISRA